MMSTPSPQGATRSSSANELNPDLKQRAEALFPYLKHLAAFDGYTMTSWLDFVKKHVHPESYVFLCEDIVLIVILTRRLILACGKGATKQRFDEAIGVLEMPTARELSMTKTKIPFDWMETPPTPGFLRSIGQTRTVFDGGICATKRILHEVWDFCHIRFHGR